MTKNYTTLIITIFILIFNMVVFIYPKEIIESSANGLVIWQKKLIPSLLPFIFINNLARESGAFFFLGNLICSPISKVLKLSNLSTITYISSLFSGYPMGTKLVHDNLNSNAIKKAEANNVVLFSNISSPLFVLGTVGATLLSNAQLGVYLLLIQIFSSLFLGYIVSFFHEDFFNQKVQYPKVTSFTYALSFSITNAISTITIIGCYVVILSILYKMLVLIGVMKILSDALTFILIPFGFTSEHSAGLIIGFFEMTSGVVYLTENEPISPQTLSIISGVLAFGGLSINCQCISFLNNTDVSSKKFMAYKFIQATIAFFLTLTTANLMTWIYIL